MSKTKAMENLLAQKEKLAGELRQLEKAISVQRSEMVKEQVAEAVTLTDKIFTSLFRGAIHGEVEKLRSLVKEIVSNDPQAEQHLLTDRYGLEPSAGLTALVRFALMPLFNGKDLATIIDKCGRHRDNPYLGKGET